MYIPPGVSSASEDDPAEPVPATIIDVFAPLSSAKLDDLVKIPEGTIKSIVSTDKQTGATSTDIHNHHTVV